MTMKILWGTKSGAEPWQEDIITTDESRIPAAMEWAKKEGFINLRVAEVSGPPDFAGTVNI
jgi:hypothetical protein